MKKFYLFNLLMFLLSHSSYSQTSCANAIQDFDQYNLALPAVGTVAPAGPDYGTLDILTRPVWGYMMSCDSSFLIANYEIDPVDQNSLMGMIVWGPFHSKADACNNLTSSNIFRIRDSIPWYPSNYNGPPMIAGYGEIYIYMLTTNNTTPNSNLISWSYASVYALGGGILPCYLCNDEVSQMLYRPMCMITFDSTSQKTKLIWEKKPDVGVGGYIIYRSTSLGGIMDSVGYVPESMPGEFVDSTSHPLQYNEFYKFLPIDSCGNRYTLQECYYGATGFLQTSPSGNNTVNLNLSSYFGVGQPNQFEPVLYVHRGSTPQNMQIIDTIPLITTYTDITAPPGQQYYALEWRRFTPCDPLRVTSSSTLYTSSMTNPSVVTVTGIPIISDENLIEVNPVPVIDILNVNINSSLIGSKLTLVDISGKIHETILIQNTTEKIDVSDLSSGSYWICITGKNKIVKKIIVGK